MFKECGLIEKYGSGIGRIKKFCKEHRIIEPKFQEIQKGFQVTLYKKRVDEKVKKRSSRSNYTFFFCSNDKFFGLNLEKHFQDNIDLLSRNSAIIRALKDGYGQT